MCVIVAKSENVDLQNKDIIQAIKTNPDGYGIVILDDNHFSLVKSTINGNIFKDLAKTKNKKAWIHFRFATHGKVTIDNVHPFFICGRYYVMHNGIVSQFPLVEPERSDTYNYCTYCLAPILEKNPALFGTGTLAELVKATAGNGSKWIIIDTVSRQSQEIGDFMDFKGMRVSNTYSFGAPAECTPYTPFYDDSSIDSPWRDRFDMRSAEVPRTFEELTEYAKSDLVSMAENDPEGVAELIYNFLTTTEV
jgi:hypothetical protein